VDGPLLDVHDDRNDGDSRQPNLSWPNSAHASQLSTNWCFEQREQRAIRRRSREIVKKGPHKIVSERNGIVQKREGKKGS
jgi:hypothetical protein